LQDKISFPVWDNYVFHDVKSAKTNTDFGDQQQELLAKSLRCMEHHIFSVTFHLQHKSNFQALRSKIHLTNKKEAFHWNTSLHISFSQIMVNAVQ
jgi:hypothetical protein